MRVLGRAQVPDKYHSTTVVPRASTTVLVPRAIARGTTYLVLGTWYLVLGTWYLVLVWVLALKLKATLLKSKTEVVG
jgi:hypothetical protein